MNNTELTLAKDQFQERINSLEHGTVRCFWDIKESEAPGYAFFPPVMYAFATIDYFSSYWAGWNRGGHGKNQTDRITDFMHNYLFYLRKNSQIAVELLRHKLMHTGEPRPLLNRDDNETYDWIIGKGLQQHMILAETDQPNKFVLAFNPFILIHDLREGVFGSNGYFKELQTSNELKTKYCECLKEMGSYEIKLTE